MLRQITLARKTVLVTVVGLTAIVPLFFLRLDESTFTLNLFKLLAKAGSLCGTVLLVWQFLLGYRGIGGRLVRDFMWVLTLHKRIGTYALILILLHPVFITLYYLEKKQLNPLTLEGGFPFNAFVLCGMAALAGFGVVVITSVFYRTRMKFKHWYGLHLTSYAAIGLIFIHSIPIGQTLARTQLSIVWWGLLAVVTAVFLYRLLNQIGIGVKTYRVSNVIDAEDQAREIVCQPVKGRLAPDIGQFVYFRRNRLESGRPFTVSRLDHDRLSITVKAQGSYSTGLHAIEPGQRVYLDGPYGVFLRHALQSGRPLVMIAGGIGITPFYRLLTDPLAEGLQAVLFYGSQTTDEIIYRAALDSMDHVTVVHVISDQPDYPGEKGFITKELLLKYVRHDLSECEFLLCGPPVMIHKVEPMLSEAGIPARQIHHELFSF